MTACGKRLLDTNRDLL